MPDVPLTNETRTKELCITQWELIYRMAKRAKFPYIPDGYFLPLSCAMGAIRVWKARALNYMKHKHLITYDEAVSISYYANCFLCHTYYDMAYIVTNASTNDSNTARHCQRCPIYHDNGMKCLSEDNDIYTNILNAYECCCAVAEGRTAGIKADARRQLLLRIMDLIDVVRRSLYNWPNDPNVTNKTNVTKEVNHADGR